jgi:Rrf2 family transcriptional regulator, nitric oxide-sensitive transcriptional repressor
MRLTTMTDYAMRLLMYVAHRPERLCTIAEVAEAYGISEAHLMKITHQLGQAGFIETVRGKGGGMRLAALPGAINLGAVVRRMEADLALVECFERADNRCVLTGHCRLAGVLDGALGAFMAHLDLFTLADLAPTATMREPARPGRSPAKAARQ